MYEHQKFYLTIKVGDDSTLPEINQHLLGKHGGWEGRPYRRGKNRCLFCGSPDNAKHGPSIIEKELNDNIY